MTKSFGTQSNQCFSVETPWGEKIVLIERGEVISDDKVTAECLNSQFVNMTNSLDLDPSSKDDGIDMSLENKVDIARENYKNHQVLLL